MRRRREGRKIFLFRFRTLRRVTKLVLNHLQAPIATRVRLAFGVRSEHEMRRGDGGGDGGGAAAGHERESIVPVLSGTAQTIDPCTPIHNTSLSRTRPKQSAKPR